MTRSRPEPDTGARRRAARLRNLKLTLDEALRSNELQEKNLFQAELVARRMRAERDRLLLRVRELEEEIHRLNGG